jgi:hypothetical protein
MLEPGNVLAGMWGWLVGTEPGAGMAVIIIVCGGLAAAVGMAGYAFRPIRNAEQILPDHQATSGAHS